MIRNALGKRGGGFNRGFSGTKTLSEFGIKIKKHLEGFLVSHDEELILEPMEKEQRKVLHGMIWKMGLAAKSKGKDPNRYMIITKRRTNPFQHVIKAQDIDLTNDQVRAIQQLINHYPIKTRDVECYLDLENFKDKYKSNKKPNFGGSAKVPPWPMNNNGLDYFRQQLPAYKIREQILQAINSNQVTLITGGTGCGKTTQVTQFLLEQAAHSRTPIRIICTQPRRLPAIAVASRVARERGEELGRTVGYHIRLEQRTSEETALTYCTSGILLRMLTADAVSNNVTHIILDEIHERELNTDYLLIALKQALKTRHDLKVILMSATMEGSREMFLNYFENTQIEHIQIPSRLYDVETFSLPDVLAMTEHNLDLGSVVPNKMAKMTNECIVDIQEKNLTNLCLNWDKIIPTPTSAIPKPGSFPQPSTSTQFNWSKIELNIDDINPIPSPSVQILSSLSKINFDAVGHLNERLPDRPKKFLPDYATKISAANLDRISLVKKYFDWGGIDWTEGIDQELVVSVVKYRPTLYLMDSPIEGSILIFLPGYEDILAISDKIEEAEKNFKTKAIIFMLHSQMYSVDQQKVFESAPRGYRKVILSTNIAEASLTIDDVVFVIDCGKSKEKSYDHESRVSQLKVQWIAKSNAEQRAGRAGRCRNGFCFRLYTKEQYNEMDMTQSAEMKKAAIHEVCLHAKIFAPLNISVRRFLEMAPEPPTKLAIDNSLEFLEQIGAVYLQDNPEPEEHEDRISYKFYNTNRDTESEPELSRLGRLLAHMPLEPQLARLLLFGLALKCFDPILTLVAALSHREPFILPANEYARQLANIARDEFAKRDYSDHLMLMRAFNEYCKVFGQGYQQANKWCKSKFLSFASMKMIYGIRLQLWNELKRMWLISNNVKNFDDYEINVYSNSWPMIQAAILAGCYPGVGVVKDSNKMRKIRTCAKTNATFHPSSIIKRHVDTNKRENGHQYPDPKIEYLAYQELVKIEAGISLRMVTAMTPLAVLLLAGTLHMSRNVLEGFRIKDFREHALKRNTFLVEIEPWLAVQGRFEDLQPIMRLRFKLIAYFLEFLKFPTARLSRENDDMLACLNYVLCVDHQRCGFQNM